MTPFDNPLDPPFVLYSPDHPNYVKDDDLNNFFKGETRLCDLIKLLRDKNAALVRLSYEGGNDEGDLEIEEVKDTKGNNIALALPYNIINEICHLIIDLEIQYFSGSGDGNMYGGLIEFRLDTLQTREVEEWWTEVISEYRFHKWK